MTIGLGDGFRGKTKPTPVDIEKDQEQRSSIRVNPRSSVANPSLPVVAEGAQLLHEAKDR